jgi:hypothetical protein
VQLSEVVVTLLATTEYLRKAVANIAATISRSLIAQLYSSQNTEKKMEPILLAK